MAPPGDMATLLAQVLRGRHDVHLAVLFGSHARGSAGPGSDVDIAVLAPEVDLLALAAELSEAVAREVDVVSLGDTSIPLLAELVRDGVAFHEGRAGALADWRLRALLELETDGPWYRKMRDAYVDRLASTAATRESAD